MLNKVLCLFTLIFTCIGLGWTGYGIVFIPDLPSWLELTFYAQLLFAWVMAWRLAMYLGLIELGVFGVSPNT